MVYNSNSPQQHLGKDTFVLCLFWVEKHTPCAEASRPGCRIPCAHCLCDFSPVLHFFFISPSFYKCRHFIYPTRTLESVPYLTAVHYFQFNLFCFHPRSLALSTLLSSVSLKRTVIFLLCFPSYIPPLCLRTSSISVY
jgi:hypothetical protein